MKENRNLDRQALGLAIFFFFFKSRANLFFVASFHLKTLNAKTGRGREQLWVFVCKRRRERERQHILKLHTFPALYNFM